MRELKTKLAEWWQTSEPQAHLQACGWREVEFGRWVSPFKRGEFRTDEAIREQIEREEENFASIKDSTFRLMTDAPSDAEIRHLEPYKMQTPTGLPLAASVICSNDNHGVFIAYDSDENAVYWRFETYLERTYREIFRQTGAATILKLAGWQEPKPSRWTHKTLAPVGDIDAREAICKQLVLERRRAND